jgi:outer membrane protein assembly factor BamE
VILSPAFFRSVLFKIPAPTKIGFIVAHTKFRMNQVICAKFSIIRKTAMLKNLLGISIIALLLSSCGWVHKMDIEQGNIITPEMTSRIHPGMSQAQVKEVMGSPVLINTFSNNRMDYVYTNKPGNSTMTEKMLILTFDGRGILINIRSS